LVWNQDYSAGWTYFEIHSPELDNRSTRSDTALPSNFADRKRGTKLGTSGDGGAGSGRD